MSEQDARFEDGDERPLALAAEDAADLEVIAALVQDSILPINEMQYLADEERFALLLNRFRWEDRDRAKNKGRAFERVQAVLVFDAVSKAQINGISTRDTDQVLSLLSLSFEAGEDGGGRVLLHFAGDGDVALDVSVLDAKLKDVTRPYIAPSGRAPEHDLS